MSAQPTYTNRPKMTAKGLVDAQEWADDKLDELERVRKLDNPYETVVAITDLMLSHAEYENAGELCDTYLNSLAVLFSKWSLSPEDTIRYIDYIAAKRDEDHMNLAVVRQVNVILTVFKGLQGEDDYEEEETPDNPSAFHAKPKTELVN